MSMKYIMFLSFEKCAGRKQYFIKLNNFYHFVGHHMVKL